MTIGLRTIRSNPSACIIIIAAGEGKATVVRAAIEDPVAAARPASSLHAHPGARFYVTHGAALHLTSRKAERLGMISTNVKAFADKYLASQQDVEKLCTAVPPEEYLLFESFLYDVALNVQQRVTDLQVRIANVRLFLF